MYELDTPAAPSLMDLQDQLVAANAAADDYAAQRNDLEVKIRAARSVRELGPLHEAWQEAIELQDAAHHRRRELLELLGTVN